MSAQSAADIAIKSLGEVIAGKLAKPLFLCAEMRDGQLEVRQVEFLTVDEFAQMVKVEPRTVYLWMEKRLIEFYKPRGTAQNLIALSDALAWVEAGKVERKDN
jgi:excisionase family DNA binding protein